MNITELLTKLRKELEAQPAPRTYEVARALSLIDAVEAAHPPKPEPPFREQSINTERMMAIADELESEGHYTMATSVRRITQQRDTLCAPKPPAEWMDALAQVIEADAKEWDGIDRALIQGRIRYLIAQHYTAPAGDKT